MRLPPDRAKEGSLPPGGTARSAADAPVGAEVPPSVEDWDKPATQYVTLSLLVERDRLQDASIDADAFGHHMRAAAQNGRGRIAAAIEPMFEDIADRERQIFSAEALVDVVWADARDPRAPSPNACETIDLRVPGVIRWRTEGDALSADFGADWQWRDIRCRYFWFLHSNGDLSYHVSLELPYRHCLRDYYALALLQKVLFPSETPEQGYRLAVAGGDGDGTDLTQFVAARFNAHFAALLRHQEAAPAGAPGDAHCDWWSCLIDGADASAGNDDGADAASSRWQPRYGRAAFLMQDPCFDEALRGREQVLDGLKQAVAGLDGNATDARTRALLELAAVRDPDIDEVRGVEYRGDTFAILERGLDPRELALIFLSGYLQNIIDFFRQDDSEFDDGTDPLYPEVLEDDPHFLLYATQDTMYEVVRRSRSLASGGKCIGICPYLFLVHVTLFHDEALLKRFEAMIGEMVQDVEDKTGRYRHAQHLSLREMKDMASTFQQKRLRIFGEVEKHMHLNVFRYDTEQAFYRKVMDTRAIDDRQQHWAQVMARLSDTIEGFHELAQQRADALLNKIVLLITVLSIYQVLFGMTQAMRNLNQAGIADWWDRAFVGSLEFVLWIAVPVWLVVALIRSRRDVVRVLRKRIGMPARPPDP